MRLFLFFSTSLRARDEDCDDFVFISGYHVGPGTVFLGKVGANLSNQNELAPKFH